MLKSIREIAAMVGTNRETVGKRIAQLGLVEKDGEKGAKLYDTRALLRLIPPTAATEGAASLEEARIRSENAKAEKTELEIAKMKQELASVDELMASQNAVFDEIATIVKKSGMSDADKEDVLSAISAVPRKCWGDF